jgi:hypothetical protein
MADDRDAADRAAYEATGNPLYLWAAIGWYAADEPLPAWIRNYLGQTTLELWRLVLDPTVAPGEAQKRTARALGLVSPGRNCFAEARHLRNDSFLATLYGLRAATGATAARLADVAGINPGGDQHDRIRSFRRRIAKVRRIWPRG